MKYILVRNGFEILGTFETLTEARQFMKQMFNIKDLSIYRCIS